MTGKNFFIISLLFVLPSFAFAGNYTTTAPTGDTTSPVTISYIISDFAQRDYGASCTTGFIPAEIIFNYWFDQGTDFNTILPPITPTSDMINSGIYTATLNLPIGLEVYSMGAEFWETSGQIGVKCGFYGNQPAGVSTEPWNSPAFTIIATPPPSGFRMFSVQGSDDFTSDLTANVSSAVGSLIPLFAVAISIILAFYVISKLKEMFAYGRKKHSEKGRFIRKSKK